MKKTLIWYHLAMQPGKIVVLNGVPRAGKTSIARALVGWHNIGVDLQNSALPTELLPGIGLRPGGERPDLEPMVERLFLKLYSAVRDLATSGENVAVDVGHHDFYSQPLGILPKCAAIVMQMDAYLVGVRCPADEIRRRREATNMPCSEEMLLRWEKAIHHPGIYDLEVDTSVLSAKESVSMILERVESEPKAFRKLCSNLV